MANKGKWLTGTRPEEPVSRAAERALEVRLAMVERFLRLAAQKRDESEAVHQLRVATRRAASTLEAYSAFLPQRRVAWMQRQLKRVRRVAGEARDFDVLSERLERRARDESHPAWDTLVRRVRALRHEAQRPIVRSYERLVKKHFHQRINRLLRRLAWRGDEPEPNFAQFGAARLAAVAEPFWSRSLGPFEAIDTLHEFRIAGKRLRYAIEIFAEAFDPALRNEAYPIIEQLQERLGEVNDHAQGVARYETWLRDWNEPELAEPLGTLLSSERSSLAASRTAFSDWWTTERATHFRELVERTIAARAAEQVA